jgi:hypothetical protein
MVLCLGMGTMRVRVGPSPGMRFALVELRRGWEFRLRSGEGRPRCRLSCCRIEEEGEGFDGLRWVGC